MIARRAPGSRFERPIDVGDSFRTVPVERFVRRTASIIRLADQAAPATRIVVALFGGGRRLRCRSRGYGGCAVKVRVDAVQLFEVMGIGSRTERACGIGARVREIIHADRKSVV